MLDSLEIRNYRNLRHLTIEKLGRVNLLVGKNNTGKTSALEAISIFASTSESNPYIGFQWLLQLLEDRGEYYSRSSRDNYTENNIKTISSIFCKNHLVDSPNFDIYIGSKIKDITDMPTHFSKLSFRNERESDLNYGRQYSLFDYLGLENYNIEKKVEEPTFVIENLYSRAVILLSKEFKSQIRISSKYDGRYKYQFVKTINLHKTINSQLWDAVVLTQKEEFVLDALRIIEPKINRITFIGNDTNDKDRRPVVKYEDGAEITPLRSMGDGINRILTIVLAMVNCENGYLLVDEFENGLHYSVQEKLWEIIFYLAERLNIQVFATTHSLDCVEAFSSVLNNGKQNTDAGAMIRLENYEGNIEATVYDADEIQATTRVHVDPR